MAKRRAKKSEGLIDEVKLQITDLYNAGYSMPAISRKLQVTTPQVWYFIKNNLPKKKKDSFFEEKQRVLEGIEEVPQKMVEKVEAKVDANVKKVKFADKLFKSLERLIDDPDLRKASPDAKLLSYTKIMEILLAKTL